MLGSTLRGCQRCLHSWGWEKVTSAGHSYLSPWNDTPSFVSLLPDTSAQRVLCASDSKALLKTSSGAANINKEDCCVVNIHTHRGCPGRNKRFPWLTTLLNLFPVLVKTKVYLYSQNLFRPTGTTHLSQKIRVLHWAGDTEFQTWMRIRFIKVCAVWTGVCLKPELLISETRACLSPSTGITWLSSLDTELAATFLIRLLWLWFTWIWTGC